jgi:cytosine/adenosine deaminase-related metal-dependent hydrolase
MKTQGTKVQIGLAPHSVYTLSQNALSFVAKLAKEKDLFLTIHLAESRAESELIMYGRGPLTNFLSRYQLDTVPPEGCGMSSAAYLRECGILDNRLVASHGVWVDDEDLKLLRDRGVGIALCVRSNHFLKNGRAPLAQIKSQGIHFGIGTDSLASNSSLDLFEELRFFKSRYQGFSDEELLKMITISSAEALGMSEMIGSIEKGKKADLVVMQLKRTVDPSEVFQYLIDEGGREDVLLSLVDGKVIFERGEA